MAALTTRDWQQLDSAHYLHPFTDYKALAAKGSRIVTRAEGVYIYTNDGDKILFRLVFRNLGEVQTSERFGG